MGRKFDSFVAFLSLADHIVTRCTTGWPKLCIQVPWNLFNQRRSISQPTHSACRLSFPRNSVVLIKIIEYACSFHFIPLQNLTFNVFMAMKISSGFTSRSHLDGEHFMLPKVVTISLSRQKTVTNILYSSFSLRVFIWHYFPKPFPRFKTTQFTQTVRYIIPWFFFYFHVVRSNNHQSLSQLLYELKDVTVWREYYEHPLASCPRNSSLHLTVCNYSKLESNSCPPREMLPF